MKRATIMLLAILAASGVASGQGLTIWTTFGDRSLEWLRGEADSFSSVFDVPISIVTFSLGELKQLALQRAPDGEAGDLFVGVPHDQVPEFAQRGIAADMRAFATSAYLADLSEQARLAYTFDGGLVGLPMFVLGPALVVNDALVDEIPATYEELVALAVSLTSDGTFGFVFDAANFYFAYGWINTFGGYVFGSDDAGTLVTSDVGLGTEGAIRGARAIRDLQFTHGLIPAGTDYDRVVDLFFDGALAMTYDGPWAIAPYRAAGIAVSVHPMPPLADGTAWSGFMGVEGLLLNPFSSRRADAANFAKWITRTDAQVSMAERAGHIPASLTALALIDGDPVVSGFGRALLDAEPMPSLAQMDGVWGPVATALRSVLGAADSDVGAAMRRAAAEIRRD